MQDREEEQLSALVSRAFAKTFGRPNSDAQMRQIGYVILRAVYTIIFMWHNVNTGLIVSYTNMFSVKSL